MIVEGTLFLHRATYLILRKIDGAIYVFYRPKLKQHIQPKMPSKYLRHCHHLMFVLVFWDSKTRDARNNFWTQKQLWQAETKANHFYATMIANKFCFEHLLLQLNVPKKTEWLTCQFLAINLYQVIVQLKIAYWAMAVVWTRPIVENKTKKVQTIVSCRHKSREKNTENWAPLPHRFNFMFTHLPMPKQNSIQHHQKHR